MKSKDIIILNKILKYISDLFDFIKEYDYEKFSNDKKTVYACVFNLSQIGELAGKISEETQAQNPRYRMARTKIFT